MGKSEKVEGQKSLHTASGPIGRLLIFGYRSYTHLNIDKITHVFATLLNKEIRVSVTPSASS